MTKTPTREQFVQFIVRKLESAVVELRESFKFSLAKVGFRHCALDDLLLTDIVARSQAAFPTADKLRQFIWRMARVGLGRKDVYQGPKG